MISTFVLFTVVSGVCRLALNWGLRRKLGVSLGLPPILALALVILTGLPNIYKGLSQFGMPTRVSFRYFKTSP